MGVTVQFESPSQGDPCVYMCVHVHVHVHSSLFTLLIPEGWDWEAEMDFTRSCTLLCCSACFHEHRILESLNKTKWDLTA